MLLLFVALLQIFVGPWAYIQNYDSHIVAGALKGFLFSFSRCKAQAIHPNTTTIHR